MIYEDGKASCWMIIDPNKGMDTKIDGEFHAQIGDVIDTDSLEAASIRGGV